MVLQPLRIIFAGTPDFAAQHLEALLAAGHHLVGVLTQPDRASGRGKRVTASPVKRVAMRYALPLFQAVSLRSAILQQQLAALQADVMVVVAYGLIFPQRLLTIPRLGCINVHASLLPRWRGAAPIQRALLAGDNATGITIMQMDAGLDSGSLLQQVVYPITAQETSASLHDQLACIGPPALLQSLQQLAVGQATLSPQDHALATYAEKIKKQEAELDWQLSALELERSVRAFNPWPLSYFRVDGNIIKVWQAAALPPLESAVQSTLIAPKTIINADRRGIYVATALGILNLQQLQLAGKRPISAQDLLNAHGEWFTLGRSLD